MSPSLRISIEGDGAWPDLVQKMEHGMVIHLGDDAEPIGVSALRAGMSSGKPSVALRFDLPTGYTVLAETSLRLFLEAADMMRATLGDPRQEAEQADRWLLAVEAHKPSIFAALDHVAEKMAAELHPTLPQVEGMPPEEEMAAGLLKALRSDLIGWHTMMGYTVRALQGETDLRPEDEQ